MDNYPNHLRRWLQLQHPYGTEKDFKEEYIHIYTTFFKDNGINGLDFEVFMGKCLDSDALLLGIDYYCKFIDISLYYKFLINEANVLRANENNPSRVLTSEYQKDRDIEYMNFENEIYYFSYEVRQVLNTFFVWNEETQTVIFHKFKYKSFTKNIEKIVMFLLSDELYTDNNPFSEWEAPEKVTLPFQPLIVSEPKPQQIEPIKVQQPFKKIQWHGTPREAMELIKALALTETLKDNIVDIVEVFNSVFEIVNNKNSKITKDNYSAITSKITAPERQKQPKFLNKLIQMFEQPTPPKLLIKLKDDFKSIMREEK